MSDIVDRLHEAAGDRINDLYSEAAVEITQLRVLAREFLRPEIERLTAEVALLRQDLAVCREELSDTGVRKPPQDEEHPEGS